HGEGVLGDRHGVGRGGGRDLDAAFPAGVGDMAAHTARGVHDGPQQRRRLQHGRVQGRAAPPGDQQFGPGEHGARPGGGQVVEHRGPGEVADLGEGRERLGVEDGAEDQWLDRDKAAADGWTFDAAKAESLLQEAGYAKGADGFYAKDGQKLGPWKLITPQGWTDWNAALEVVAKNLQAIGVDASTNFPQQAQTQTAIQNGDFDMACWYVAGTGRSEE